MKAHEQAKAYGLKNLKQITECTGKKSQTLRRWHREEPELFKAVCFGVKVILIGQMEPPKTTAPNLAPWPDFNGHDLYVGDSIIHPDGEKGVIFLSPGNYKDADKWLVNYGEGSHFRLCNQIGDKGRAAKVN